MKYLLSIYGDESIWTDATPEQQAEGKAAYGAFGEKHADVILGGEALQPTTMATTVRVRDGDRLLTDGPFAETREQLGGYYVVDVPDLDTAVAVAGDIPDAARGCVEVRPLIIFDDAGAPAADHDSAATA